MSIVQYASVDEGGLCESLRLIDKSILTFSNPSVGEKTGSAMGIDVKDTGGKGNMRGL